MVVSSSSRASGAVATSFLLIKLNISDFGCGDSRSTETTISLMLEIHGHKGAPSAYPENTIAGFLYVAQCGVNAIELDVVVSKDKKVVVSHEPWMHKAICLTPAGETIKQTRHQTNFYKLTYSEIKKYDCGLKFSSKFPEQQKVKCHKPLLSEVITGVNKYCDRKRIAKPYINIEIKCRSQEDGKFHPAPREYVRIVYRELKKMKIVDTVHVQSFDIRILKEMYKLNHQIKLGVLVERKGDVDRKITSLGFKPYSYNPRFDLLDKKWIADIKKHDLKIFTWTVNNKSEAKRLIKLGVDGIITDYPYLFC